MRILKTPGNFSLPRCAVYFSANGFTSDWSPEQIAAIKAPPTETIAQLPALSILKEFED